MLKLLSSIHKNSPDIYYHGERVGKVAQLFLEYAGIKKEALVIGTGATIEIWSPEILQLTNSKEESIGELAESLDVPMDFEI